MADLNNSLERAIHCELKSFTNRARPTVAFALHQAQDFLETHCKIVARMQFAFDIDNFCLEKTYLSMRYFDTFEKER